MNTSHSLHLDRDDTIEVDFIGHGGEDGDTYTAVKIIVNQGASTSRVTFYCCTAGQAQAFINAVKAVL